MRFWGGRMGIAFSVTGIFQVITNPYGCLAHLFSFCYQGAIDLLGKLTKSTGLVIIKFKKMKDLENMLSSKPADSAGIQDKLKNKVGELKKAKPLYRYWNGRSSDHFYTTNYEELKGGNQDYVSEGVQCCILPEQVEGTIPLYRYWNNGSHDHFYTTNWSELGSGNGQYAYEGVQGYVYAKEEFGTIPLYRYWNGRSSDHFYTTNWSELGNGNGQYAYEGVQCYVFKAQ